MDGRKALEDMKGIIEKALESYESLYDKATLSNIRYFLKGFMDEHRTMEAAVSSLLKGKHFEFPDLPNRPKLDAVGHISLTEDTQVGSLQSVLLFICRKEEEISNEFDKVVTNMKGSSDLNKLKQWQEQIFRKAEHLYTDLIEAPSK
ncbi:MAG TPA: hypothetical protein VKU79_01660 [Thermoplasmataceae archaeon]|nr:hypothetical protein [Thermoplasmatales archaeon AK]HLH85555.1 hypothetical protein [Thermoplasmataceae archaeon]